MATNLVTPVHSRERTTADVIKENRDYTLFSWSVQGAVTQVRKLSL